MSKTTKTIIYKPDAVMEGWYTRNSSSMCALLLPPHPLLGGNIANTVLRLLNQSFSDAGFNTLRINFRGVGLSQGNINDRSFDLQDALEGLDWLSVRHSDPRILWVAGFGYGGYITINAAMRRPGVHGFISVTPYSDREFDFNVLTPCPNGMIITGAADKIVECNSIQKIANELSNQKGCSITFRSIEGADHNYTDHRPQLYTEITNYLNNVLGSEISQNRSAVAGNR